VDIAPWSGAVSSPGAEGNGSASGRCAAAAPGVAVGGYIRRYTDSRPDPKYALCHHLLQLDPAASLGGVFAGSVL